jgi:hypothetical protein
VSDSLDLGYLALLMGILPSYSATSIMKITYGKNTPTAATDPEVLQIRQLVGLIHTTLNSDAYLVEWIRWLKYLPWYARRLKRGYESTKRLYNSYMNRVRQQMVRITSPIFACFLIRCTGEQ